MNHPIKAICPSLSSRPETAARMPSAARELSLTYHAFEVFASRHLRELGLTPGQFSVMSVLAKGTDISCKALGQQAGITKGTLTGIVDRLEQKGLARRSTSPQDRRSSVVNLTDEGRVTFERVANHHFAYLQEAFAGFDHEDLSSFEASFRRFREFFNQALRH
ncbi:MarR family transcriptional regulator [Noviherbaspirillum sp.]|uniref:MarR family winged helix-turn-helix transcriptional regulator n=1 Tax=Noviherbaspirillum sp. TaxID=1926288 RepID=UPI002B49EF87|nr:MarR family transcriptional regulator [Noviherbaspirillum sp.]HJV80419.1 MarR family transcriptional regulator [Noviherbaspirillum sp.]